MEVFIKLGSFSKFPNVLCIVVKIFCVKVQNLRKLTRPKKNIILYNIKKIITSGKLVQTITAIGTNIEINISFLPSGIYFLRIGTVTERIVKQ